ncbi:Pirin [Merluccius polli]|uniref:Pirin n=1 Tax=Merluccius polli TaxID=89951 RepID=A0AA47P369_MERPO|nr:Pirin [Merluccius polli]
MYTSPGPLRMVTYILEGSSAHEDFCGHSVDDRGTGGRSTVGLQLWVNLPGLHKMVEPSYQELKSRDSKVYTRTPTLHLDFTLQPGAEHVQPVPAGPEEQQQLVEPHPLWFFWEGDCVKIENKGSDAVRFVLIAGEPIGEPVVQRPFVMTTEEEMSQAIRDYQSGRNGFERAVNWRSKIRDRL